VGGGGISIISATCRRLPCGIVLTRQAVGDIVRHRQNFRPLFLHPRHVDSPVEKLVSVALYFIKAATRLILYMLISD
jgi:hypothetical protein